MKVTIKADRDAGGGVSDFHILAIDPGKVSGVALAIGSRVVDVVRVTCAAERRGIVLDALTVAEREGAPLVVVVEQWTVGAGHSRAKDGKTRWTPATMLGLGAQRGRWLEALDLAGVPASRIVSVTPAEWRAVLSPLPRRTTEQAKASAIVIARGLLGREVGPDEAEAACIARWASSAAVVREAAAKRVRRRKAA